MNIHKVTDNVNHGTAAGGTRGGANRRDLRARLILGATVVGCVGSACLAVLWIPGDSGAPVLQTDVHIPIFSKKGVKSHPFSEPGANTAMHPHIPKDAS